MVEDVDQNGLLELLTINVWHVSIVTSFAKLRIVTKVSFHDPDSRPSSLSTGVRLWILIRSRQSCGSDNQLRKYHILSQLCGGQMSSKLCHIGAGCAWEFGSILDSCDFETRIDITAASAVTIMIQHSEASLELESS